MPIKSTTDGLEAEILRLSNDGVGERGIAAQLGVSRSAVTRAIARIQRRSGSGALGFRPVLPGYEIRRSSEQTDAAGNVQKAWVTQAPARGDEFELPAGHEVKGVSALTDGAGNVIQQWVKTRKGELSPEEVVERCKAALEGYAGAPKVGRKEVTAGNDRLTLVPINDWHVGMYAWGREAAESWDLSIAEDRLRETTRQVVNLSMPSMECVLLVGGDLLHADNLENRTTKSGHALDVDGRYAKVLETAARLLVDAVEMALQRHQIVKVRVLRGNHDEHSAMAVALFLKAWFKDVWRVEIDTDPGLFWWLRFGKVMLGSTHGHTVRPDQMPAIMASRRPEDWGQTKHRYVHTFHLHHKRLYGTEEGGVVTEIHQAPIPQDAWHYGAGFLSGRSMQAITYHEDRGEIARVRVALG